MKRIFVHMSRQDLRENAVYLILWLILFASPVIGMYYRSSSSASAVMDWNYVFWAWRADLMLLVPFVIHNYFIAPLLLREGKKLLYAALTAGLIAAICLFQYIVFPIPQRDDSHFVEMRMQREHMVQERADVPPAGIDDLGARPDRQGEVIAPPRAADPVTISIGPMMRPHLSRALSVMLILGINVAIKLMFKSSRDEKKLQEMQQEKLQQELEYLKYQINPHFFMNTLNNIHALVDIDPEKAKKTIIGLSKLMRYVLYESSMPKIMLSKEIEFLRQYISLMRLRYTDNVRISVDMPDNVSGIEVPPLLFIPFIENAFKHGVSYEKDSFIHVSMNFEDGMLSFSCSNSIHESNKDAHSGIGLENVRKRLQLLYNGNFIFRCGQENNVYNVLLKIPANDDTMPRS